MAVKHRERHQNVPAGSAEGLAGKATVAVDTVENREARSRHVHALVMVISYSPALVLCQPPHACLVISPSLPGASPSLLVSKPYVPFCRLRLIVRSPLFPPFTFSLL